MSRVCTTAVSLVAQVISHLDFLFLMRNLWNLVKMKWYVKHLIISSFQVFDWKGRFSAGKLYDVADYFVCGNVRKII